jgi:hypothetical protein
MSGEIGIMMTDEEALKFYEELLEHYNGNLPNFEHCPKEFLYKLTLYKYHKERLNTLDN